MTQQQQLQPQQTYWVAKEEEDVKRKNNIITRTTFLLCLCIFVLLAILHCLLYNGAFIMDASSTIWVYVPLFGYCRYDIAAFIVVFIEIPALLLFVLGSYLLFFQHHDRRQKKLLRFLLVVFMLLIQKLIQLLIPQSLYILRQGHDANLKIEIDENRASMLFSSSKSKGSSIGLGTGIVAKRYHDEDVGTGAVTIHSATGFTSEEAKDLVRWIWSSNIRKKWTHISMMGGGFGAYFQLGSSINFDRIYYNGLVDNLNLDYGGTTKNNKWLNYSFKYGFNPTSDQLRQESAFRLFFDDDIKQIQELLSERLYPKLRNVLADTLDVPSVSDIIFGNEIDTAYYRLNDGSKTMYKLGGPAVGILLPNTLMSYIQHPHSDYENAKNRIPQDILHGGREGLCSTVAGTTGNKTVVFEEDVLAFIIPLNVAEGSGLRYWTRRETTITSSRTAADDDDSNKIQLEMHDVDYKVGNVYSFRTANTIHAVRNAPPLSTSLSYSDFLFPYLKSKEEDSSQSARIVVQAFGVKSCDNKWYFYH